MRFIDCKSKRRLKLRVLIYARSDFVSLFAVFVAKKHVASSSKRSRSASRGCFPREGLWIRRWFTYNVFFQVLFRKCKMLLWNLIKKVCSFEHYRSGWVKNDFKIIWIYLMKIMKIIYFITCRIIYFIFFNFHWIYLSLNHWNLHYYIINIKIWDIILYLNWNYFSYINKWEFFFRVPICMINNKYIIKNMKMKNLIFWILIWICIN